MLGLSVCTLTNLKKLFRKKRRMFLVRTVVAPMNTDTTDETVFIGSTLRHYVNYRATNRSLRVGPTNFLFLSIFGFKYCLNIELP